MALSIKDPVEKVIITFDFSANTKVDVSNPSVTVSLHGTLTDIPAMKANTPVVEGNKVRFICQGGSSGSLYDVKCVVDLANGERLLATDILHVKTL